MPWSAQEFKNRHNHSLTTGQAGKAARQATAMIAAGVPEGEAIAVANKHAAKRRDLARELAKR